MNSKNAQPPAFVCVALAVVTLVLYFPAFHFGFVGFDDPTYVVANPHVNSGFHWSQLGWFFQDGYAGNWHPLTWISHAVDCQLFGLNAGGHHAVNILLHVANTLLVFLVLFDLTGALWRSAMVAALFAWHPLHVESVAWISERKDVLSAFFFLLTIMAYARYARGRKVFYTPALVLFALGLMSKPMIVTLPCVLLLLDFWPLGRLGGAENKFDTSRIGPLILEKIPFFVLSLASSIITIDAQNRDGVLNGLAGIPLKNRLVNGEMTYWRYLQHTIWPSDLGASYPYLYHADKVVLAVVALILVGVTVVALRVWKTRPYWPVGWLWFAGMLVPVVDIFHAGGQAMADRYMYLPAIGLFVLICWDVCDVASRWPRPQMVLGCLGAIALAACLTVSSRQLQIWRNEETLVSHIAEPASNGAAHGSYAYYLMRHDRLTEAEAECRAAMRASASPEMFAPLLGEIERKQGKLPEAEKTLREAINSNPQMKGLHLPLGEVLLDENKPVDAAAQFDLVIAAFPKDPEAHWYRGNALIDAKDPLGAVQEFAAALKLQPNYPNALNDLAWLLATDPHPKLHDPVNAVKFAERACLLTTNHAPQMIGTLAAAYAANGRFDEAAAAAQKAHDLAIQQGLTNVAKINLELQGLYKSHKAYYQ